MAEGLCVRLQSGKGGFDSLSWLLADYLAQMWKARKVDKKLSVITIAAIIITVIALAYWAIFELNEYNTFHLWSDSGVATFSMYYKIHYSGALPILQYLSLNNHIAPDQLLLLPIFAIWQSVVMLLLIKVFVVVITGLMLYFISRDLLKNEYIAFALMLFYFVNPGVIGIIIADYRVEILFMPFYLLTFYYYMKLDKKKFAVSLLLFLGVMEESVLFAIPLALGLIVYNVAHVKDKELRRERINLSLVMILATLAALLIYNLIFYNLSYSYQHAYLGVPQFIKDSPYPLVPITRSINQQLLNYSAVPGQFSYLNPHFLYSLVVGLFGFGLFVIATPLTELIFAAPWLFGIFSSPTEFFTALWSAHFTFVLSGTIVATILGIKVAIEEKSKFKRYTEILISLMFFSFLLILCIVLFYPNFLHSTIVNNYNQQFLFQTNPGLRSSYAQLYSVISQVPANASLMTQYNLIPYFANRKYLEAPDPEYYYFKPEYVLIDFAYNITLNIGGTSFEEGYIAHYVDGNTYKIYAINGSAILYKLSS